MNLLDGREDEVKIKLESRGPKSPFTTYDFINMAPHGVSPPLQPTPDWNMAVSNEYHHPMSDYRHDPISHQRQLPQLHRLHTLSLGRNELGHSSSVESLSAYAESDYASPISQSFPHDDAPFLHSPAPIFNSYSSRNSVGDSPVPGLIPDTRGPTSCPDHYYAQSEMSSSISSHQNLYDIAEGRQQSSPGANEMYYEDEILGKSYGQDVFLMSNFLEGVHRHNSDVEMYASGTRANNFGWTPVNDDDASSQAASDVDGYPMHLDPMSNSFSSETSPRISFFLDYYEKIICPSVVAMDCPSNPYRKHILSLAASSRSLTHAICALSACNLRMKRKQSLGQDHWKQQPLELEFLDRINGGTFRPQLPRRQSNMSHSPGSPPTDSSLQEEYQHRSLAVQLLNQQLSDPSKARHDHVLATLFILCHYRMCESGVAQFRTQFAGVKKILGMRDSGVESGNWGWMETLFTYFDGITASINDREAQLRGGYLEMIANPTNPNHSLENLAGCDAVLFKTIGKLGRLNMLSQHRAVASETYEMQIPHHRRSPPRPRPGLAGQALVDFYSLHAHNFDGNGFASTLDDDASFPHLAGLSDLTHDDLRTTFWTEWKAARTALQEWEFDPSRLLATLPSTPSPTQLRDFGYISEAFRYSALLYTERLACPSLPSSHLNFQNLVSQVLFYVTSLEHTSQIEKFLLWPLFVCGSECVNELQQSIVRTKCREIMGRSGYLNNLAGLEVLEKLWAERNGEEAGGRPGTGRDAFGGPFRWTRYMEGSEGEWIMV